MGLRFRRSVKLAPGLKLNIGKRGFSLSAGKRGATVNLSKRGIKATVGIPGSGLSYSTNIIKGGPSTARPASPPAERATAEQRELVFPEYASTHPTPSPGRAEGKAAIIVVGALVAMIAIVVVYSRTSVSRVGSSSSPTAPSAPAPVGTSEQPVNALERRVPSLPADDVPSSDNPNYFDARELGSKTVAVFAACETAASQFGQVTIRARRKCLCLAEAARRTKRIGDLTSGDVDRACETFSTGPDVPSPFAEGDNPTFESIVRMWTSCVAAAPKDMARPVVIPFCACAVDGSIKHGDSFSLDAAKKCRDAAQHVARTGRHLTTQQFGLLH